MNIRTVLLAMFNTTNEIGYWTMQERDFNILPYLSKQVRDLLLMCHYFRVLDHTFILFNHVMYTIFIIVLVQIYIIDWLIIAVGKSV